MRNIFTKMLYSMDEGQDVTLVVITEYAGSAPRGSGSMMLVGKNGYLTGTIGGGAIENTAIKTAQECIENKSSITLNYDLSTDDKKLGMACGGAVTVCYRYVGHDDKKMHELASHVLGALEGGEQKFFRVDLTDCSMIVTSDGMEGVRPGKIAYMPVIQEERAIIFGGGHIALDLVPILKRCGFKVIVFDDREEFACPERFPDADEVICGDFTMLDRYLEFRNTDYIAIMTSGHVHDYEAEEQALRKKAAYIGVIGSRKKTQFVNSKLRTAGISEEMIAGVHTPIGLDIKAVTPAEIAVSIAAEMIKVRAELRDKK